MSVVDVMARVAELELRAQRALKPAAPPATAFADTLAAASVRPMPFLVVEQVEAPAGGTAGERALAAAQAEVGVTEEPPGSNDGARIAVYRSAVAGSYPGAPWCAYFVSWAAAQAGTPIGDNGQGLGSVEGIAAWAARTGRLLPQDATPQPGDLILFGDRHVGIVESVEPDGSLVTVEGNSSQAVSRVRRVRSEATGFARL